MENCHVMLEVLSGILHQRDGKILSLYACGMSQRDIAEQVKELYGVEISPELVTKITEKIMPEVTA